MLFNFFRLLLIYLLNKILNWLERDWDERFPKHKTREQWRDSYEEFLWKESRKRYVIRLTKYARFKRFLLHCVQFGEEFRIFISIMFWKYLSVEAMISMVMFKKKHYIIDYFLELLIKNLIFASNQIKSDFYFFFVNPFKFILIFLKLLFILLKHFYILYDINLYIWWLQTKRKFIAFLYTQHNNIKIQILKIHQTKNRFKWYYSYSFDILSDIYFWISKIIIIYLKYIITAENNAIYEWQAQQKEKLRLKIERKRLWQKRFLSWKNKIKNFFKLK